VCRWALKRVPGATAPQLRPFTLFPPYSYPAPSALCLPFELLTHWCGVTGAHTGEAPQRAPALAPASG